MDNPITESPKVEDEEEEVVVTVKDEAQDEAQDQVPDEVPDEVQQDVKDEVQVKDEVKDVVVAASASPPPIIDYEARKLARDAKAKRKDEKTVQQVLKSLDNLKSPEEKLSAMCKKYSELLHENRQLQGTVKQSEKNILMIHREKEQFRHERSKAVLAKTRMEQLCRELQKLNKAQQEETALKLRVEEEKRKEICITFQSAFAEMNTLTNQNNEKSAKMREENLEMREKIKAVRERIELTETQLDKVRQQAKLELELAREKLVRVTLELTAEKEALMKDKTQLLMKLAKYHVRVKEQEGTDQFLRKQIKIYEEKFEEFKKDVKKTTESLKNFRPESREMKKKMLKLEKETTLWKQRWEKTNAAVVQMTEIKEKRDAEMLTLNNKLATLQELCKVFQRERTSLLAQLREKNEASGKPLPALPSCDENRKSMKQVENISKDCEKLKDNLSKLEGSLSEAMREACRAPSYEEEPAVEAPKPNKKTNNRKAKKIEARNKTNQKKEEKIAEDAPAPLVVESNASAEESSKETSPIAEEVTNDLPEKSQPADDSELETCAAEIAILERHETVLKDIEKVLAEHEILEAKIAGIKEMGKMFDADDDCAAASEISASENQTKSPEKLPDTEESKIESESRVNEKNAVDLRTIEKSGDKIANEKSDDKIVADGQTNEKSDDKIATDCQTNEKSHDKIATDCQTNEKSDDKNAEDDSGLSITEFEIVDHGSCVPDNATSESELSVALDSEKSVENPADSTPSATIADAAKSSDSVDKDAASVSEKIEAVLSHRESDQPDATSDSASSETPKEKAIVG